MDTSIKYDHEGNLIKPLGLTAGEKDEIREIFRECSKPPKRYRFSEEGIENFITALNPQLFVAYKNLNSYDLNKSALRREQKKLLCALEKAIAAQKRIDRLETEAITEHSIKFIKSLYHGMILGRIKRMKLERKYRDLYQRRDKIKKELDNSKQGRPPAPEICLDLIEAIAESFERHLGYPAREYYPEGPFVKIAAFSLKKIGYPTSNPAHLFKQLQKRQAQAGLDKGGPG